MNQILALRAAETSRLKLDTLINLRWLAVAGQSVAVLVVHFLLAFPVALTHCFTVIAVSAWLNLVLRIRFPMSLRLPDHQAAYLLAFDIVQLGALLYLTGGLSNPFAVLILAPVMISATALSPLKTFALGALGMLVATLLMFYHRPLPWPSGEPLALPLLYMSGIWTAILLGLSFTGIYAWRVSEEARQLADALSATELVLAREQHLSQLDGLAAAAAHELGTPLATITLVAKDLDRVDPTSAEFRDDVALLREQVARCRDILGKLKGLGTERQDAIDTLTVSHLMEDVIGPLRSFGVEIAVTRLGEGPEPRCLRNPGITYSLENLVENAIDFAATTVAIAMSWTLLRVTITITDDGPGFAPEVIMRLGEPYLTTRSTDRRAKGDEIGGLGLGLFIAKTLIERSGAVLSMTNADSPAHGAVVSISWPRVIFERGVQSQH